MELVNKEMVREKIRKPMRLLHAQLVAPEVSSAFFSAKPTDNAEIDNTIFDITEVNSILKNLDASKDVQKTKPIERPLDFLGKLPEYQVKSKYQILFKGFLTTENDKKHKAIHISLVECMLREKRAIDVRKYESSNKMEEKKQIHAKIIGTEDDSGNFIWQKFDNINANPVEDEDRISRVKFDTINKEIPTPENLEEISYMEITGSDKGKNEDEKSTINSKLELDLKNIHASIQKLTYQ